MAAWLEHQLYEFRTMGIRLSAWSGMSVRWTWLCLLLGGCGSLFLLLVSSGYHYYVVLYGGGAVLMAMLTMLFDGGIAGDLKEQLLISRRIRLTTW